MSLSGWAADSSLVPDTDYYIANNFERAVRFEVAADVETALANFPVLVRVSETAIEGFTYGDLYLHNGRDLLFLDANGEQLPHEIDTWNPAGESLIWVRLPSLEKGVHFSMCYRGSLANVPVSAENAFSSYVGVWHLSAAGDGTQTVPCSTVNDLDGQTHFFSLDVEKGVIGGARRVAQRTGYSASFGHILIPNDAAGSLDVGSSFTMSFWMQWRTARPDYAYLVSRKETDYDPGWGIQYNTSPYNPDITTSLRIWTAEEGQSTADNTVNNDKIATLMDGWHHVAFVYEGTAFKIYIDGDEAVSTTLTTAAVQGSGPLVLGGLGAGHGAFNGELDEARLAKSALTAEWIKAEHATESDAGFLSSAAVYNGPESEIPFIEWAITDDFAMSIVDLSYAYVQFSGVVRNCGKDATRCTIQYRLWPDGQDEPADAESGWTTLVADLALGDSFSVPVPGLTRDMPYKFQIRAINNNAEAAHVSDRVDGAFRTYGYNDPGTGGTVTRYRDRYVHTFTNDAEFTAPDYATTVEILVVGGGGAGGYMLGGGGGGGGVFCNTNYTVTPSVPYTIKVGTGGKATSSVEVFGGNGTESSVSLGSEELIRALGGGAGGNYNTNDTTFAAGQAGGSGGGGSYGQAGGTAQEGYGYAGGTGNTSINGGYGDIQNRSAAGGGGGILRKGLDGSPDMPPSGGAGGNGLLFEFAGTSQYYGAGGGGGVRYITANSGSNWSTTGMGGSNFGGDAANPRENIPARSGVPNTGAGGGGGSINDSTGDGDAALWQGGDGADGIVVITYVVSGEEKIPAQTPLIELNSVAYTPTNHLATLGYRISWAGEDADVASTVYALYSFDRDALVASNGTRAVLGNDLVGTGEASYEVTMTATNYYVRLVAENASGKIMYSDEILFFEVPGLNLDSAAWVEADDHDLQKGYATLGYRFHWARELKDSVKLNLLWSTVEADLMGDASGASVVSYAYGQGYVLDGVASGQLTFSDPRLKRGTDYYVRLQAVDADGSRTVLSPEVCSFSIPVRNVTLTLGEGLENGTVVGASTAGVSYPENTSVTVEAKPASGWYVAGWKVALSADALATAEIAENSAGRDSYTLVLTENTWILPVFAQLTGARIVRAVQRYPWNNLVDIDYNLAQDATNARLVFFAEDKEANWKVQLKTFRDNADVTKTIAIGQSDSLRQQGLHRVTWDANADGVARFSRNVVYTLYLYQGQER
ncbi:MAG: glycine-rich domain-containing protein [Kiritimatiellia bacterium]